MQLLSKIGIAPKKPEAKKTLLDKATTSKILRTVPHHEGFHFFTDIGKPTYKVATSLIDFNKTIQTIDVQSINFHFKRQDFEKWIKNILGDTELSRRINKIKKDPHGEKLRNQIIQTIKELLKELQTTQT